MHDHALAILKTAYGPHATFRDGQWEAIQSVLENKRTLVVQQTGWGKSVVYFIATKLLRNQKRGLTLVISPLLALMRNQIAHAAKYGLNAVSIDSQTIRSYADFEAIINQIRTNQIDMLFISPEQLANQKRIQRLQEVWNIGLFAVDEAHCISDWGHDFRPDYRRIVSLLAILPQSVPILATTATANSRVISDIQHQLGHIQVMRGPLARSSLAVHIVPQLSYAERLAWLATHIPTLMGSGLIYTITIYDCNAVSRWLKSQGVDAHAYHSEIEADERITLERRFDQNEIKCLVATTAFGMGYDKPDVGFVIHFQRPGNIVSYYQQIGRAGRELSDAPAILLNGEEDNRIQQYFIQSAFPTLSEMNDVVNAIAASVHGLTKEQLLSKINITDKRLSGCLKYLEVENTISSTMANTYIRTSTQWAPNLHHSNEITAQREIELNHMQQLTRHAQCYMSYIVNGLDDASAQPCMKCSNCLGTPLIPNKYALPLVATATHFVNEHSLVIQPRKQWPAYVVAPVPTYIPKYEQLSEGRALSKQGDIRYSAYIERILAHDTTIPEGVIPIAVQFLQSWLGESLHNKVLVAIPSIRFPNRMPKFVRELSRALKLERADILQVHTDKPTQSTLYNSYQMCTSLLTHMHTTARCNGKEIILVDDYVNTRWTFTVAGHLLRKEGAISVTPFALLAKKLI